MSGEIWVNSSVRNREKSWDSESGGRERRSGPMCPLHWHFSFIITFNPITVLNASGSYHQSLYMEGIISSPDFALAGRKVPFLELAWPWASELPLHTKFTSLSRRLSPKRREQSSPVIDMLFLIGSLISLEDLYDLDRTVSRGAPPSPLPHPTTSTTYKQGWALHPVQDYFSRTLGWTWRLSQWPPSTTNQRPFRRLP